jgi:transcriptional regulator with XRE-family HTH domain
MSDFGARLREPRERRGVSLRDIAARTRFSAAAQRRVGSAVPKSGELP